MNQTTLLGKLLSPAGFGLVLLLFFLPFVAVSCGPADQQVTATFSGLDMITGAAPAYSGPDVRPEDAANLNVLFSNQYDSEPLAVLAAAVVLGAMATAFIRTRRTRHVAGISLAVLGAALLLAAELRSISRLNHITLPDDDGLGVTQLSPVTTWPRVGFYLAAAVLVALAVGHTVALLRPAPLAGVGPPDDGPPYPPPEFDGHDAQWQPEGPPRQPVAPPIWAADEDSPPD